MKGIENGQEVTFLEQVDRVLFKKNTEEQKRLDVKKIFLHSDNPLVLSVVRGDTTFSEMFKPLMQEYDRLRPTSLLTATCMNEEFMQKANELNQKVSGVIPLGLNMVLGGIVRYCDITSPFSRATLVKKAYETNRVSISIFMVSLMFYLLSSTLLDISDIFVIAVLDALNNFLSLYFLIIVIMFLFSFYLNYLMEYRLRKDTCAFVCIQVARLDEIVNNLFFRSK